MIPTVTAEDPSLTQGNVSLKSEADLPTKTYYMNLETKRISGLTDGKAAMKQAIFKILQTERFVYSKIYTDNYGSELWDLIGMPLAWILSDVQRRITEALTWDKRITSVSEFEFSRSGDALAVSFVANTIFGAVSSSVEVQV